MIARSTIGSLVMLLVINVTAHAQEVIGVSGLSGHSLTKLKDLQREYINDAVVTLKSTQSFPPYLQHGFILRFRANDVLKLGAYVYGTSTAARSLYEDYSGMVKVDQSLRCLGVGLYSAFLLTREGAGTLSAYCVAGVNLSRMKTAIDIHVSGSRESISEIYTASSPMAEVGLEYTRRLGASNFTFLFSGGFHLSKERMLTNEESGNEWEYVNWTGGKMMAGIGYKFVTD